MSLLIKVLVVLFVTGLVASCKVAVMIVEGGEVESIGSGTCEEGTICIVEVIDTNFSESFTAVPNPGWHFVKWNSGEGFFCGDSTDPTCVLSTVGTAGIEAIIASDQTFYIMPIFGELDTVTVDGREWAQVDHFTLLSWNDINAVCPAGVCSGILNGYNMTGWTWASVDDVNALFNHYIGSDELGPGPDKDDSACSVVGDFFSDGWRPLLPPWPIVPLPVVNGFTRSSRDDFAVVAYVVEIEAGTSCRLGTNQNMLKIEPSERVGGWFWRSL